MDKLEHWSGVFRLYCWTSGWLIWAEPQSNIVNLLRVSVAEVTWKWKRQMDQANVLYTRYCDVVIGAVVECKSVPKINAFVMWFGCWINELSSKVYECISGSL